MSEELQELKNIDDLLNEHEFFIEITYRPKSIIITLVRDDIDEKTDFVTFFDMSLGEACGYIKKEIMNMSIEAKLGKGPFSVSGNR